MHNVIIIILIIIILVLQGYFFYLNYKKISFLKKIFPPIKLGSLTENDNLISFDEENSNISSNYSNSIFQNIISSINNYLKKNKNSIIDYHLIKDIVERNCDSLEDEIHTQNPIPLYLGLGGTMLSIIVGVGFLLWGGGLDNLFNPYDKEGAKNISPLLGGVAMAMITSVMGILLTTTGTILNKRAKATFEANKNKFLSWIQIELLPNFSQTLTDSLNNFSHNLNQFNNQFAENAKLLLRNIAIISQTYTALNNLDINNIARVNIEVYRALMQSSEQITQLVNHLRNINGYIDRFNQIYERLDNYERRTQVIERAGEFYTRYENWLAENINNIQILFNKAIDEFSESYKKILKNLQETIGKNNLNFQETINKSNEQIKKSILETNNRLIDNINSSIESLIQTLNDNLNEFSQGFDFTGLHNLLNTLNNKITEESQNLISLKGAIEELNQKIENIAKELTGKPSEVENSLRTFSRGVEELKNNVSSQNAKLEGLSNSMQKLTNAINEKMNLTVKLPMWLKISIISGSGMIIVSSLFYIISKIF